MEMQCPCTILSYNNLPRLIDCHTSGSVEASDGFDGSIKLSPDYSSNCEGTASDVLAIQFDVQLVPSSVSGLIADLVLTS